MGQIIIIGLILLFIYNLLKPKKKQGKSNVNDLQELQKLLSSIEQENNNKKTKAKKTKNSQKQSKTQIMMSKEKVSVSGEENIEVYDNLSEYIETKKRKKGFENLDKSQTYTDAVDTETSFQKETEKWIKQSHKDNKEHSDSHNKKSKFSQKDIKKAYILNQILERKYI